MATATRKDILTDITTALQGFGGGSQLYDDSVRLLGTLGYRSQKTQRLSAPTFEGFRDAFSIAADTIKADKALVDEWVRIDFIFQLGDTEVSGINTLFENGKLNKNEYQSFLFIAIELKGKEYKRAELVAITRELNKPFFMPVIVLFYYDCRFTLSIIDRRLHKRDSSKDVLEKVTLIKDINLSNPQRAHLEILKDLSLEELRRRTSFNTFTALHEAWKVTLNVSELNKKFYRELANWYEWAIREVEFPKDVLKDDDTRNPISVIRLITRLIFIWFLKEKGLVPDSLFNKRELDQVLTYKDKAGSTYYKAILQNLFFATLNAPMNRDVKKDKQSRTFIQRQHGVQTFFRYENLIKDRERFQGWMDEVPFLNGGLFECLDKRYQDFSKDLFIDGFTQQGKNEKKLRVPDELFFDSEHEYDLNEAYGTRGKKYAVRGLINILNRYKFTIEENTPVEEEVALDPELLGKVFENLLASYNEETKTTARKMTGSFYTPREIVSYMVDESLMSYLKESVDKADNVLRALFSYTENIPTIAPNHCIELVKAIDHCTILDPACGSGAFPMGVLQRLVYLLAKLDPDNTIWRDLQKKRAMDETEEAYNLGDQQEREDRLKEISETFENNNDDYGRKLYLIENCIYGIDKQPIAVQIAKLRFFISLIADQKVDNDRSNRGVRPLPNLETKFVAADTLVHIEKPVQLSLINLKLDDQIKAIEHELHEVRERHFRARLPSTKEKCRERDAALRLRLASLLEDAGFSAEETKKLSAWDPYDQNTAATFFDSAWMFEIRDGFDIVIGNPPYYQIQKMKSSEKSVLEKQNYKTFSRTGDMYLLFYEHGINLLKSGGCLCYITSNSWMQTQYGQPLRKLFNDESKPEILLNFENELLFESAIVEANVLLSKREKVTGKHRLLACTIKELDGEYLPDYLTAHGTLLDNLPEEGWTILSYEALQLKQEFESQRNKQLAKWAVRINRGILTGFDRGFYIDAEKRRQLIDDDPRSAEIIKPALRGRDIKRYGYEESGEYLIAAHNGYVDDQGVAYPRVNVEKNYPAIYEHLNSFQPEISERRDQGSHWTNLRNCAYQGEFQKPKILWAELADGGKFTLDEERHYANKTLYVLTGERLKYLLGILNSKAVLWYYGLVGATSGMGATMWQKVKMILLPIPVPQPMQQQVVEGLADILHQLNAKHDFPEASLIQPVIENVINGCVYELYLPEEVKNANLAVIGMVAGDLQKVAGLDFVTVVQTLHSKWTEPANEIRNRLLLMPSRCPKTIGIIESSL